VLIMAHRPAAIKECDMLLVLEGGMRRPSDPRDEVLQQMVKNHQQIQQAATPGGVMTTPEKPGTDGREPNPKTAPQPRAGPRTDIPAIPPQEIAAAKSARPRNASRTTRRHRDARARIRRRQTAGQDHPGQGAVRRQPVRRSARRRLPRDAGRDEKSQGPTREVSRGR
jgi:hypothetical protein